MLDLPDTEAVRAALRQPLKPELKTLLSEDEDRSPVARLCRKGREG